MNWRHECEVRYVANLGSNEARAAYLALVSGARGQAAAKRLRVDAWALMKGAA